MPTKSGQKNIARFCCLFLRAIIKGFTFWKVILFMPKSLKWAIIVENALFMKNNTATFSVTISQCELGHYLDNYWQVAI